MKKIMISILLLVNSTAFACSCIDGFSLWMNKSKDHLIAKHLGIPKRDLQSVEVVSYKERNTFVDGVAKIILFPLYASDECIRACVSAVKLAGTIHYLVDYTNSLAQTCRREIKFRGSLNTYGNKLKKYKIILKKETCF